MDSHDQIIEAILESDEDIPGDFEVHDLANIPEKGPTSEMDKWLINAGFSLLFDGDERYGRPKWYRELGARNFIVVKKLDALWYEVEKGIEVEVNTFKSTYKEVKASNLIRYLTRTLALYEEVNEAQEDDPYHDPDLFKEITGGADSITGLKMTPEIEFVEHLINTEQIYFHGCRVVNKSRNRFDYTSTEFDVEFEMLSEENDVPDLANKGIEQIIDHINDRLVDWNRKILRELRDAYDDMMSVETVAGNIIANEYRFDEEGRRDENGYFLYDQLNDEAKETAINWWSDNIDSNDYEWMAEPIIAEWKWLLKNKGFSRVKVQFSGFYGNDDYASFTADNVDMDKVINGPDPLLFPEQERDQLVESEDQEKPLEPGDEFEVRDLYQEPQQRREIRHINTKSDYEEFERRFKDFIAKEGIEYFQPNEENEEGYRFSMLPCDCCARPTWGNRYECLGYNKKTHEIKTYDICPHCLSYSKSGRLNDDTMEEIKNNPDNPLAESEEPENPSEPEKPEKPLEPGEEFEMSDICKGTPERREITRIETKADYEEFEQRFQDFLEREDLSFLSQNQGEDGDYISHFSWIPCDCCQRALRGERFECLGYSKKTNETYNYNICLDCFYYSEYDKLDDETMENIKNSPDPDES
jgi:hypothetical protein